MKKNLVRAGILFFCCVLFGLTGCLHDSASPLRSQPQSKPTAKVNFVINGLNPSSSLRGSTAPEVLFQLKLLDPANSSNPLILFKKSAVLNETNGSYSADVSFSGIPTLPCMAEMNISGGSLVSPSDSQSYSDWVGLKELVSGENTIVLCGKGSKIATDVAHNLLEQLIVPIENVTMLPTPVISKINAVIDNLDLTSATVYSDAYDSFVQTYNWSVLDYTEFNLPENYTSVAYPATDTTTSLSISNFNTDSEVYLVFMNRTSATLNPKWSASLQSPNIRINNPSVNDSKILKNTPRSNLPVDKLNFHLKLRQSAARLPRAVDTGPALRASIRAVDVGNAETFKAFLDHDNDPTTSEVIRDVAATCVRKELISGTSKYVYFFLDDNDQGATGLDTVLDGILSYWTSIYTTNRTVFGAEPEGTLNGVAVDDFYILLSSQLYTAGYFYSGDMYPPDTNLVDLFYTNEKKMFYLQYPGNSDDLNRSITDLASTMAHEFQHMTHFYQKRELNDSSYWLDESMSGYAEYINGFKIETGENQSKALQVEKYLQYINQVSVNEWHGQYDPSYLIHSHYGQAYLFGTWLAQNYGSSGSVQNLLSVQLTEEAAVEAFTGEDFERTFAKFMMSILVNDSTSWTYGFKGLDLYGTYSFGTNWADVTLDGPAMTNADFNPTSSGDHYIYPYCAAYVKITGGDNSILSISASLPSGTALFQLKKN
ncbi:MAG: hypothetical protein ACQETH_13915 [Candidatus Rifleibacteriota bacterium]